MSFIRKVRSVRPLLWHPRSREELLGFQQNRFLELVRHCYENVAYYRELFDAGNVRPEDIRGIQDLGRIPMSSKADLLIRPPEELVDRRQKLHRLVARHTTGSCGQPFTVHCTWFEDRLLSMYNFDVLLKYGLSPRDRLAKVKISLRDNQQPAVMKLFGNLGIFESKIINSLQEPQLVLETLRSFRPHVVTGYPAFLSHLALEMDDRDRALIHPRFLMVGGETLTAMMRRNLEGGFDAVVREVYGSHEFNYIAWECPVTGLLHVNDRTVLLEVQNSGEVSEDGQGGEVILTALHSFAQPFLRFRLGDWVVRGPNPCPCGLPVSTLRKVAGRRLDWVELPDGRHLPPERLFMVLSCEMLWIRQYQLVQEDSNSICLKVVARLTPSSAELEKLNDTLAHFVKGALNHRYELVERIPLGPAGKFQLSKSLLRTSAGEPP